MSHTLAIAEYQGGKKLYYNLPCDPDVFDANFSDFFDTKWSYYSPHVSPFQSSRLLSPSARYVTVRGLDHSTKKSTYISFYCKADKSTDDIVSTLRGLRINDVKFDEVLVVSSTLRSV